MCLVVPCPLAIAAALHERHTAEEAAQKSREILRKTLSSLDEAVLNVTPQPRIILDCNETTERMFGYRRAKLLGGDTTVLHVDKERAEAFGRGMRAAIDATGFYQAEFEMRRKNGEVFATEHFVRPVVENGRTVSLVSAIRDISERRRAE